MTPTATRTAVHVMDSSAGFAMRYQLDAMINALDPIDQDAVDAGDADVTTLIARLHEAREAAVRIEGRDPREIAYKGVTLVKS